ncbi:MAG: LacI family DNA-binding transcriptional regulator [Ruminococcus sp.]|nr:LacI family DNA-binding transcriptional regulator [Ruminococcus sp.]
MIDIAKEIGVSVVTVSNALAGRDGVSDKLRQRICDTAERMGYRPSNTKAEKKTASQMKPSKSVGILTSERFVGDRGTFYWELTATISNKLSENNIYTVYECVPAASESERIMPKMITEKKIDGIIVIGQIRRRYIELLSKVELPLIFVDFYDNRFNVDSVNSDSYYGGYLLTDYLVEMGHRKIGFFGNVTATSSIHDRFLGYIKCIMENNLEYRPEWTLDDRDEYGTLYTKINFPEEMPTAFVCNCDETAFRVISALKSKGIRVPEDISVVGYDNYTVSNICIPTITTVEVNINKMAAAAVEIIAKKLDDPSYTEGRRIISGRLIEKNSVLDIRGSYAEIDTI